eukprot:m.106082 g.106082  ORF g.106082 m.106082 type:complete len:510 (-) comp15753_c0_seq2:143-1672(-)
MKGQAMAWGKPSASAGPHPCIARLVAGDPTLSSLTIHSFRALPTSDLVALFSAAANNTVLTELGLSGHQLEPEALHAAVHMLQTSTSLRRLSIGSKELGSEGLAVLATGLDQSPSLEFLDLEYKGLDADAAGTLAHIASACQALETLKLGRNALSDAGLALFFRQLASARGAHDGDEDGTAAGLPPCRLASLDLSETGLGAEACEALATLLTQPSVPLCELTLSHNTLGSAGLAALAPGVAASTLLRALALCECGVGAADADEFLAVLAASPALAVLDLTSASLTASNVQALARALVTDDHQQRREGGPGNTGSSGVPDAKVQQPAVATADTATADAAATADDAAAPQQGGQRQLILRGNRGSGQGSEVTDALTSLVALANGLHVLDLGICDVDTAAAASLLLAAGGTLHTLSLFGNGLSDDVVQHLTRPEALAQAQASPLCDIDLGGNKISDKAAMELLEWLGAGSAFPSLHTLGLGGNPVEDKDLWEAGCSQLKLTRPEISVVWMAR